MSNSKIMPPPNKSDMRGEIAQFLNFAGKRFERFGTPNRKRNIDTYANQLRSKGTMLVRVVKIPGGWWKGFYIIYVRNK